MIKFVSRYDMKRMINSGVHLDTDYAIISISDTSQEYDEMHRLLEGSNSITLAFPDNDVGMSSIQANLILGFIKRNRDQDFIIHCFMGVSRSAAVAKFINEYLGREDTTIDKYDMYNRRILQQLEAAAGTSLAAYYEEMERKDRLI